ncbi:hypothetical protein GIB67_015359, partial [Kingdonia uniflora]
GVSRTIASHKPRIGFRFGESAKPFENEGVMEVDGDEDIPAFDDSSDAISSKSTQKRHDVGSLSWKEFKVLVRKQFYPIGYEQERWYKWNNLCQRFGQSVQQFTTKFHNQELVLDIDVDEYDMIMKYTGGLSEPIFVAFTCYWVASGLWFSLWDKKRKRCFEVGLSLWLLLVLIFGRIPASFVIGLRSSLSIGRSSFRLYSLWLGRSCDYWRARITIFGLPYQIVILGRYTIRRELKLFKIENFKDATVKVIAIKGKYLKSDKKDDKNKSGSKANLKFDQKGESKGEGSSFKGTICSHCKATGYNSDRYWKLHPELRPKE